MMDNYEKVKKIGEGAFGKALLVKKKEDGKHYVIKEVNTSRMRNKEREEAKKEVKVLAQMHHPNIVAYRESFEASGTMYIVMDYCDGGDLYSRINKQRGQPFPEDQIVDWFVQLCLAVKHVHDRKILHRDIKTQNIFLTKSGRVKLGDFGIARVLNSTVELARTCIGTPYYLSPEICENRPYNNKSDIWAMGCVLYETTTLKHAFEAGNMKNLVMKIIRGSYPPVSSSYSYDLRHLIAQCLKRGPRDRPTVNAILRMGFIQRRIEGFLSQSIIADEFAHTILHRRPAVPAAAPVRQAAGLVVKKAAEPAPPAVVAPFNRRNPAAIYGAPVRPQQRPARPGARVAARRPAADGAKAAALRLKERKERERKLQERKEQERKEKMLVMQKKRKEAEVRYKKQQDDMREQRDRYEANVKMRQQQIADRQQQRMRAESAKGWQKTLSMAETRPLPPDPLVANKDELVEKVTELKQPQDSTNEPEEQGFGGDEKRNENVVCVAQSKELKEGFDLPKPAANPAVAAAYQAKADREKAAVAAERARIVEEFLSRRKEAAANRARAEIELGWKGQMKNFVAFSEVPKAGDVLSQHREPHLKPSGRNAAEKEYLARLEAIRRQNFQERRNLLQRNNRQQVSEPAADDTSPLKARDDPHFDPDARRRKIAALKAQADLRAAQLKEQLEKKRAAESKVQDAQANKDTDRKRQEQNIGFSVPVKEKEVNVTRVVKPSQQAHMVSEIAADVASRKKWGNRPAEAAVDVPLSRMNLEVTSSNMEATSANDKVVVPSSSVSELETVQEGPGESDRKKWAKPAYAVALAVDNVALQSTHTINPLQAIEGDSNIDGKEEVNILTDKLDHHTGAVETLSNSANKKVGGPVTVNQVLKAEDAPPKPGSSSEHRKMDDNVPDGKTEYNVKEEQEESSQQNPEQVFVEGDLEVEEIDSEAVESDSELKELSPEFSSFTGGHNLDVECASEATSICSAMAVAGSPPRTSPTPTLTPPGEEEEIDIDVTDIDKGVEKVANPIEQLANAAFEGEKESDLGSCDEVDNSGSGLNSSFSDGLKTGSFDVNVKILRTCSMPDLKKVLNAELPEDGDFVVGHKNIDESDHVEGAVSNNIPGSQIAEADDQAVVPMEQAQLKDDHPEVSSDGDDEEMLEMLATMKTLLEDSYAEEEEETMGDVGNEEDDTSGSQQDSDGESNADNQKNSFSLNESWTNSDGDSSDQGDVSNDDNEAMVASEFGRLEETRHELEKQLGFDRFMKAYRFIEAIQEDEDEAISVNDKHAVQVGEMLGEGNDHLYPAILKLVMADAAYCETCEPDSDKDG